MYYSAFCLQNKTYFGTGSNSKTKRKCLEYIYEYLISTSDFADEVDIKNMKTRELEIEVHNYEVEIHKHKAKIQELEF
jgi:hypothetical protein